MPNLLNPQQCELFPYFELLRQVLDYKTGTYLRRVSSEPLEA